MRVFTKIKGKLVVWGVLGCDPDQAIKLVRDELGVGHRGAILALVKT